MVGLPWIKFRERNMGQPCTEALLQDNGPPMHQNPQHQAILSERKDEIGDKTAIYQIFV